MRIVTRNDNPIVEVERIGIIHKIAGYYFFKHTSDVWDNRITEVTTGFAIPGVKTFAEAERFLAKHSKEKIDSVLGKAKKTLKEMGINYPLNEC